MYKKLKSCFEFTEGVPATVQGKTAVMTLSFWLQIAIDQIFQITYYMIL